VKSQWPVLRRLKKSVKDITPEAEVISTVFRPKPLEDIENKNVLFATTAPDSIKDVLVTYLEEHYGCKVVGTTSHLSNRPLLQKDIEKHINEADIMLTELKAAAVDVATKDALEAGLGVVYCDNIPKVCGGLEGEHQVLHNAIINVVKKSIDDFKPSK
jgi:cyclic 2,3-diphosphoglycerate synthetase